MQYLATASEASGEGEEEEDPEVEEPTEPESDEDGDEARELIKDAQSLVPGKGGWRASCLAEDLKKEYRYSVIWKLEMEVIGRR